MAVDKLCDQDGDLAQIVARHGPPPFWARKPGFPTLVQIILEQQVSLASARAAYTRLLACVDELTPGAFLALDDETLRGAGFSRQKRAYVRDLARLLEEGSLSLEEVASAEEEAAQAQLMRVKGLGRWTADIYLLMALRRPDIWPTGDLAVVLALQEVKSLAERPTVRQMEELAAPWRPWRAVATRLLWHCYLSR